MLEQYGRVIEVTPTVQAAAYSTGNCIGGLITVADFLRKENQSAMLSHAMAKCQIANSVEIDAILFRDNPTLSTFTDKTAAVLNAGDVAKVIRVIQFTTWVQPIGNPSFSQVDGINRLATIANAGKDAYLALIAKGSITFASAADLSINLGVFWN